MIRDGTGTTATWRENHFNAAYPINLEGALVEIPAGRMTIKDLLLEGKRQLPYNLRFEQKTRESREHLGKQIDWPGGTMGLPDFIARIVEELPSGWQATAMFGYVILYFKGEPSSYRAATRTWRSTGTGACEVDRQEPQLGPPEEIPEDAAGE